MFIASALTSTPIVCAAPWTRSARPTANHWLPSGHGTVSVASAGLLPKMPGAPWCVLMTHVMPRRAMRAYWSWSLSRYVAMGVKNSRSAREAHWPDVWASC